MRIVAGRALTSATAGDWPLEPRALVAAGHRIGATGVDYVKLGLRRARRCPRAFTSCGASRASIAWSRCSSPIAACRWRRSRRCARPGLSARCSTRRENGRRAALSPRRRSACALRRPRSSGGTDDGLAGSLRLEDIPAPRADRSRSARFSRRALRGGKKLGPIRRAGPPCAPRHGRRAGPRSLIQVSRVRRNRLRGTQAPPRRRRSSRNELAAPAVGAPDGSAAEARGVHPFRRRATAHLQDARASLRALATQEVKVGLQ